jgi:glycosyltransferase involved in cell wall biosynthesis
MTLIQKNPFVTIIIPVYKYWDQLILCINCLENQSYNSDCYEIIIVDNECLENYLPLFKNSPHVRIIKEQIPGSYVARNRGIKNAGGEIIGFTDADCLPHTCWIEEAVNIFQSIPETDRVAGNIELCYSNTNKKNSIELYESIFEFQQQRKVETEGSAITANLFVKKQIFEDIGLFNETLLSGGDTEWGKRAKTAGYNIVYAPNVIIFHPTRSTWSSIMNKTKRIYGGMWKINRSNKSVFVNIFYGMKFVKPSFRELRRIFVNKNFSFFQKLQISIVHYFINLVQFSEHYRLLFGGNSKRD